MKLHQLEEEFKELISLTSAEFGIADVLIEKDYWVTLALKNLSKSHLLDKVVFKGGTSLSKAHKIIYRFSEDIDLAVIVDEGITGNKITALLGKVEEACSIGFDEVKTDPRISKRGSFRKTVWHFPRVNLEGEYGDAGENILIEVNSFTTPEPHENMSISSLIADYLLKSNKSEVIDEFGLNPFTIPVLRAERTFVEKISAITKGCYTSTDNTYDVLSKNIRHFYDLSKLIEKCGSSVLQDKKVLIDLLHRVKEDDKKMDPKGIWTEKKYKEAAVFNDFDGVWKKISSAYNGSFKNMLYGDETLPSEKQVREAILAIAKALDEHE